VYRTAAVLLGIGLGGLADSILIQQLLQRHFMVSSVVPPLDVAALRTNIWWGGVYEAICLCVAVAGVVWFYRAARHRMPVPPPRHFLGSALLGWGVFNLVEGLLGHAILGVHHVGSGRYATLGDLLYLFLAAAIPIAFGSVLVRSRHDWMARPRRRRLTPWG
jgi:uncharacterized membrane protein